MLKNYFKIAWRDLLKHKLYAAIKIGGFASSIATCVLIMLYMVHETSYDRFYPESGQVYRVVNQVTDEQGNLRKGTSMQAPLAPALKADFPNVEHAGRLLPSPLFGAGSNQVSTRENPESFYEEGFTFIDQELLDMLPLPMVYGTLAHALDEPNTVLLTKRKAAKYFPGINPIGKVIYLNNNKEKGLAVKGVIDDVPTNSHLHGYDFFVSLSGINFYDGEQENWTASNYVTYVKLKDNTGIEQLERQITDVVMNTYYIPRLREEGRQLPEILKSVRFILQPLADIHLKSYDVEDYKVTTDNRGDIRIIWLFGSIALFLLLIACINFINLSTAKSASRAKEVGLRKVAGSHRSSLMIQFLTESMLYSMLSIVFGLVLAWLFLPLFNELSGKSLFFPWFQWWLLPLVLAATLLVGLLSGLYPAFYLSSFRPVAVLKGQLSSGTKHPMLRSGLVIFQFTTSIILIIGTLIINSQMNFILHKNLGFDKNQVLVLEGTHTLQGQVQTFKEELKKLPQVQRASVGDYLPVRSEGVKRNGNPFWKEGKTKEEAAVQGQYWEVDADYLETMGITLAKGRNFNPQMATDSLSVVINQKLAKDLNLSTPIGAKITNNWRTYTVIGVVEDFIFESLKEGGLGGVCMTLGNSPTMIAVKVKGSDMTTTVREISALWNKFSPQQAIRYSFMDEGFALLYADVQRTGHIFTCFSVLAIIIACLGLFGLAAFTTEQRTKEVGIRKVLGASVSGILKLLSKDFLRLVFVAIVIATPLAWWAMNKWLEDFTYRIEIQWWIFALAGGAAVLIALATVSFQAIKAAIANPINSLRDE